MLIVNCLASLAVAKPFSHPFLLQIFRTWDYYDWNSIIIIQIAGRRNIQHNVMNNDNNDEDFEIFDDQGLSKEFLPDRASGSCSWSGPWSRRASQRNPDVF